APPLPRLSQLGTHLRAQRPQIRATMRDSDLSGDASRLTGLASLCGRLGFLISHRRSPPGLSWLAFQTCCPRGPRRSDEPTLTVGHPAPGGFRPTKRASACLRFVKFRGSFDVVHFRYGPSVHLPRLPTPPHGGAVEVVFCREQSNSAGGTLTHVHASFPGAGFVAFCQIFSRSLSLSDRNFRAP